jgi:hypothetical protein
MNAECLPLMGAPGPNCSNFVIGKLNWLLAYGQAGRKAPVGRDQIQINADIIPLSPRFGKSGE